MLRDRHQGRRPARPVREGRQGRPVRRRRRRQDGRSSWSSSDNLAKEHGGLSAFCGVGERSREGNDLWLEMTESGVIDKTMLVFGQMNEPPGARMRVALSGLTMAEYFREARPGRAAVHRQHLPLRAGGLRGVGAARAGCPRRWATSPRSRPRWASCRSGSPRRARARSPPSRPSTCRPTTSPTRRRPRCSPTSTPPRRSRGRSRRRASTRRSTRSTRPPRSSSPTSWAQEHYQVATQVQEILQRYKELQDIIAILGIDELSDEDKQVGAARAQGRAVPVTAVLRGRGLHRHPGHLRAGGGDRALLQGDRRGRARRPAGARLLHEGLHRRGPRGVARRA